ncbi:MAG: phage major capsid protein, partial [Planctomycetaceae bacterium]
ESSAEFYRHAHKFCNGGVQDERIVALRKAAMSEGTDSTGGVFVPTQFAGEVYEAAMENAIVRPRAIILPMGSDSIDVPVLVDGTRATNIFGGVTLTHVGEGGDQYATNGGPAIGRLKLTANKFIASCFVSNELAADAQAFGPFMNQAFGRAVAFLEDDLFINSGTGSGQPLSVLNSNALISVTRGELTLIGDADIAGMAARLAPGCWQNAAWLINQSVLGSLTDIEMADLASMQILGRPIIVTEHCAAAGTIGDILLCDFSQYLIGDRSLIISSSREATYSSNTYGFLQDQTCWKLTLRVDGQPIVSAPYTPKRGGSTVSPFIALTTAS